MQLVSEERSVNRWTRNYSNRGHCSPLRVRLTRIEGRRYSILSPLHSFQTPSLLLFDREETFSFCVTSFNFRNRTRKLLGGTCSSQLGVGTARCDPKLFLPALCEDKLLLAGFLVTRREKLLSVRDKLWRLVSFGASLPSQKQFCSLTITAKRFQGSSSL